MARRCSRGARHGRRHRRDHACQRAIDDVGRVNRPPESSSAIIGGMACKRGEPRRRVISNTVIGAPALARSRQQGQRARRTRPPPPSAFTRVLNAMVAEPKTLVDTYEMRRGIDGARRVLPPRDRAHENRGRALAVGAGDVDHRRQLPSGWPRRGTPHPIERQIDQLMQRLSRATVRSMRVITLDHQSSNVDTGDHFDVRTGTHLYERPTRTATLYDSSASLDLTFL